MMYTRLFVLLTLARSACSAAQAPAPLSEETEQKYIDHINLVGNRDFDATRAVIDKYGLRLRAAAELRECILSPTTYCSSSCPRCARRSVSMQRESARG
jgi:hypothetical protein